MVMFLETFMVANVPGGVAGANLTVTGAVAAVHPRMFHAG